MHPYFPSVTFTVTVTRGRKTRYFYGETLRDAVNAAGLKKGEGFCYARFERGEVKWAEVTKGTAGNVERYTTENYRQTKHFVESVI